MIGINTAIVAAGQGIGFAIPINMARDIMSSSSRAGAWCAAGSASSSRTSPPELAESFGVKERGGVLVAEVMKGSPAEAAGLEPGDIVVELDGTPIKEVPDLQQARGRGEPGER